MRNKCICSRVAFTLVAALLVFTGLSSGQDFEIVVNGSWAFVKDAHPEYDRANSGSNNPRLMLVAPSANHNAYIYPGSSPSGYSGKILSSQSNTKLAVYYLDIDPSTLSGPGNTPDEDAAVPFTPEEDISDEKIANVEYLYDSANSRYAISLPMPDYIRTYTAGKYSGYAESIIASGNITPGMQGKKYSIWLVLHYGVNMLPSKVSFSRLDEGSQVKSLTPITPASAAISVLLMDPDSDSDLTCDSVSGASFSTMMKIWDMKEHARFPVEDQNGIQRSGDYDPSCKDAQTSSVHILQTQVENMKKAHDDVDKFASELADSLGLEKSDPKLKMLSVEFVRVQNDLKTLYRPLPQPLRDALHCTQGLLLDRSSRTDCPQEGNKQIYEMYWGPGGSIPRSATGSTDCHTPALNVNGVLDTVMTR